MKKILGSLIVIFVFCLISVSVAFAANKGIPSGMYKVGKDIKAGEYVIIASSGECYMQVSKNSEGTLDSIVCNENFKTRTIVTIKNGQYLTITNGTAYLYKDAPKVKITGNILNQGMYKVGIELKPGEYKLVADGNGYVEVDTTSSHSLDDIFANDNFTGSRYITVKKGQYLKIAYAHLLLK